MAILVFSRLCPVFCWRIDHACNARLFRDQVWFLAECKKLAQGRKQQRAFIFFAFRQPVLRFHPRTGSAFIRHISAMPALARGRQSEYAVLAAIQGACTGYLYLSIYLSIYLSSQLSNNNNYNNNWLQHPGNGLIGVVMRARLRHALIAASPVQATST